MEREIENTEIQSSPEGIIEQLTFRLAAAVDLLEKAIPLAGLAASGAVGPIVAMVEPGSREAELARKLADAEKTIAELRASSGVREEAAGRCPLVCSPSRTAPRRSPEQSMLPL